MAGFLGCSGQPLGCVRRVEADDVGEFVGDVLGVFFVEHANNVAATCGGVGHICQAEEPRDDTLFHVDALQAVDRNDRRVGGENSDTGVDSLVADFPAVAVAAQDRCCRGGEDAPQHDECDGDGYGWFGQVEVGQADDGEGDAEKDEGAERCAANPGHEGSRWDLVMGKP